MNTALKITAFTAALAAAFGAAYGVGNAMDPVAVDPVPAVHADHEVDADHEEAGPGRGGEGERPRRRRTPALNR